jgi:hypothetical protein
MNNQIKSEELKSAIIKTMVFFDLFNQPLTLFEIYKYLSVKIDLAELSDILESMNDKVKIKNGFYFLSGREEIVGERFKKYNYFKRKVKIAKRFSQLISFLPFVKGVAVSNIISSHNLKDNGDIDLFIISSKNKIFLTRFFCVFFAKFLNIRPNKKTKKDKICLSFYISEDSLNLEKYLYNQDDFYFVYWIVGLEVLVNKNKIFDRFKMENKWVENYLPNLKIWDSYSYGGNDKRNGSLRSPFYGGLGRDDKGGCGNDKGDGSNWVEKISKKIQLKIMPKSLKEKRGRSSGVVFENNIIKLFLEDKRPEFIDRFKKSLEKFL